VKIGSVLMPVKDDATVHIVLPTKTTSTMKIIGDAASFDVRFRNRGLGRFISDIFRFPPMRPNTARHFCRAGCQFTPDPKITSAQLR
jgi:hypothetical protein